jgi:23S rRNA (uridine2552-2'-O)-methyltransferase
MKVRPKSKKVNKAWLNDHVNDPYVKLAQREGYRARAAYKLKEIDETLRLIRPGQVVVDLGSAPGAWSQYLRRRFAPKAGRAAWARCDGTHHRAGPAADGAHRRRALHAGRLPRGRRAASAGGATGRAGRWTWWCRTWRPTCRASSRPTRRASPTWSNWRWTLPPHLRPEGALVARCFHGSGYSQLVSLFKALPGGQADQAQGLARQIGGNLSGRHRSEARMRFAEGPEKSAGRHAFPWGRPLGNPGKRLV